jgi:hypothetical protein
MDVRIERIERLGRTSGELCCEGVERIETFLRPAFEHFLPFMQVAKASKPATRYRRYVRARVCKRITGRRFRCFRASAGAPRRARARTGPPRLFTRPSRTMGGSAPRLPREASAIWTEARADLRHGASR